MLPTCQIPSAERFCSFSGKLMRNRSCDLQHEKHFENCCHLLDGKLIILPPATRLAGVRGPPSVWNQHRKDRARSPQTLQDKQNHASFELQGSPRHLALGWDAGTEDPFAICRRFRRHQICKATVRRLTLHALRLFHQCPSLGAIHRCPSLRMTSASQHLLRNLATKSGCNVLRNQVWKKLAALFASAFGELARSGSSPLYLAIIRSLTMRIILQISECRDLSSTVVLARAGQSGQGGHKSLGSQDQPLEPMFTALQGFGT